MITGEKEGQYVMKMGLIHQEDIAIVKYTHPTSEHLNILSNY